MARSFTRWRLWRAHRLARRWPDIAAGAWLLDLGMPTDRAVRIKWAYDIQQGNCGCRRCVARPEAAK